MRPSVIADTNWKNRLAVGLTVAAYLAVAIVVLSSGCAPNDPFDPDTLENARPVTRFFVDPVDPGEDLSPTSYFNRTFGWSGSDRDGWVVEYYVSIRTDAAVPAPWDTTTRTDTTMTFFTDDAGEAEATVLVACKDDRGAYSDTISQYVPLRNFPPVVGFQSDYNPLKNLQMEFVFDGDAVVDTVYWNFGPNIFRMFALDLDGAATMLPYYRYTLMDTEPDVVYETDDPLNDPLADPEAAWIQVPFVSNDEIRKFQIYLRTVTPGYRTLTISVGDEADADTRFSYSWEVRPPAGPVLYIDDNAPFELRGLMAEALDGIYGDDNWSTYQFNYGVPDREFILLESMRMFDLLVWTSGNQISPLLSFATTSNGVIEKYLYPETSDNPDADPGSCLLISWAMLSQAGLGNAFLQDVLGINPTADPRGSVSIPAATEVLGVEAHLPTFICGDDEASGAGLAPYLVGGNPESEGIYNLEECVRCYNNRPRWDPIIAMRKPLRATGEPAQIVTFSVEVHKFATPGFLAAFEAVLDLEMGMVP